MKRYFTGTMARRFSHNLAGRLPRISSTGLCVLLCLLVYGHALAEPRYRLRHLPGVGGPLTPSEARRINEAGQVMGVSYIDSDFFQSRTFLWDGTAVQDLGTLGGSYMSGIEINDFGEVAGSGLTGASMQHAFFWANGTLHDLGTLGGASSRSSAINNLGQVTGESATSGGALHAFLWNGSMLQDLGTLGGPSSSGYAIDNSGNVVGSSDTADGEVHAFLWDGGEMHDLGTLGGTFSQSIAINGAGQSTGTAYLSGDSVSHAVIWDGTEIRDLGTLGGGAAFGYAINDAGQVTGFSTKTDGTGNPFLWDGTTMIDLGTLGGTSGAGLAINGSGQVTGYSRTLGGSMTRAFFADASGMVDLNSLIDANDPLRPYVTLRIGVDINDRGQIAASGIDSSTGLSGAYLVTPIKEIQSGVSVYVTFRECTSGTRACDGISPIVQGTFGGEAGDPSAAAFQSLAGYGEVSSAATLSGEIGAPILRTRAKSEAGKRVSTNTVAIQRYVYEGAAPTQKIFQGQLTYSQTVAEGGDGFGLTETFARLMVMKLPGDFLDVEAAQRDYFFTLFGLPTPESELVGFDVWRDLETKPNGSAELAVPVTLNPGDAVWVHTLLQTPAANGSVVDASHSLITQWDDSTGLVPASQPQQTLLPLLSAVTGVGPGTSLADKVRLAQTYLAAQDMQATCGVLGALKRQLRAQSSKQILEEVADELTASTSGFMFALGCP